jgi:NADH-quinone oxidoreductase subunit D
MPEGNDFMLTFLTITSSEDVYTSMESLIYHFKIVMGVPIPVAEIYHPVEGGNGEWVFI